MVLPEEAGVREQVQVDCFQGVVGQAGEAEAAHLQRAEMPVGEVHLQSSFPPKFVLLMMGEERDLDQSSPNLNAEREVCQ